MITTEGKNELMDALFQSSLYVGLIDANGYAGISAEDTLASHDGWTETAPYLGDRKALSATNAVNGITTLSCTYEIDSAADVMGFFIVSATKLILTKVFTEVQTVQNGDLLPISMEFGVGV